MLLQKTAGLQLLQALCLLQDQQRVERSFPSSDRSTQPGS
jgi:hypothetical protein